MAGRSKLPNALKHGAYCESVLLPGESATDLEKLRQAITADLKPNGPLEEDIVQTITRLVWRKQNMATYRKAEMASARLSALHEKYFPTPLFMPILGHNSQENSADNRAAFEREVQTARKELGDVSKLVDVGEVATSGYLLDQLAIEDRLDGVIDRCLKRLTMVRMIKSMTVQSA
jgi:hypothetical protein